MLIRFAFRKSFILLPLPACNFKDSSAVAISLLDQLLII